jgi:hypothetical protein
VAGLSWPLTDMRKADLLLSLIGLIAALWLATVLVRRKTYREFPLFFLYVSFSIAFITLRLAVSGDYRLFFFVFWVTEAIYVALALLVLHEVFRTVFAAFYEKRWFWLFFPFVVVAIFTIAIAYRLGSPPVQASRLISLILTLGTTVSLVQVAIFGLFFLLVWFHGIRWRDYPFGIVVGFAIIAVGSLWGNWARSVFGTRFNKFFGYAPAVAYILAVIVWLDTFLRPPSEPKWNLRITPEQLLEEIRQSTKILQRLLGKRK